MYKIELGAKVRSLVSGFEGIVNGRSEWLNGCRRYSVQPPVDKDGKLPDSYYFDEAELEVLEAPKLKPANQDRGGPPVRSPR